MPLAERARPLRSLIARQPWSVLGPLLVVQWLALAVFAVAATHNGWLYYQGGDQSYYWTDAHLLSRWTLPVALVFVLLHTVTWFNLTPQAMAVRVAGRRVPSFHIIAGQYTGLVVVSAFVLWLVTR